MSDFNYCPCVDGKCPYWNLVCFGVFICDEYCPYWSNEF